MGRRFAPLELDEVERAELRSLASRRSTAQALAQRARIVLACAEGEQSKVVAARLAVDPDTVGKWRRRFSEHRLEGLRDEPRSGPGAQGWVPRQRASSARGVPRAGLRPAGIPLARAAVGVVKVPPGGPPRRPRPGRTGQGDRPPRGDGAGRGEDLPALGLGDPPLAPGSGLVAEPVQSGGGEPVWPAARGLGVASQPVGDGRDARSFPAAHDGLGSLDRSAGAWRAPPSLWIFFASASEADGQPGFSARPSSPSSQPASPAPSNLPTQKGTQH